MPIWPTGGIINILGAPILSDIGCVVELIPDQHANAAVDPKDYDVLFMDMDDTKLRSEVAEVTAVSEEDDHFACINLLGSDFCNAYKLALTYNARSR